MSDMIQLINDVVQWATPTNPELVCILLVGLLMAAFSMSLMTWISHLDLIYPPRHILLTLPIAIMTFLTALSMFRKSGSVAFTAAPNSVVPMHTMVSEPFPAMALPTCPLPRFVVESERDLHEYMLSILKPADVCGLTKTPAWSNINDHLYTVESAQHALAKLQSQAVDMDFFRTQLVHDALEALARLEWSNDTPHDIVIRKLGQLPASESRILCDLSTGISSLWLEQKGMLDIIEQLYLVLYRETRLMANDMREPRSSFNDFLVTKVLNLGGAKTKHPFQKLQERSMGQRNARMDCILRYTQAVHSSAQLTEEFRDDVCSMAKAEELGWRKDKPFTGVKGLHTLMTDKAEDNRTEYRPPMLRLTVEDMMAMTGPTAVRFLGALACRPAKTPCGIIPASIES